MLSCHFLFYLEIVDLTKKFPQMLSIFKKSLLLRDDKNNKFEMPINCSNVNILSKDGDFYDEQFL